MEVNSKYEDKIIGLKNIEIKFGFTECFLRKLINFVGLLVMEKQNLLQCEYLYVIVLSLIKNVISFCQ